MLIGEDITMPDVVIFGDGYEAVVAGLRRDHEREAFDPNAYTGKQDKHGIPVLQSKGSSDRQARQAKYAR